MSHLKSIQSFDSQPFSAVIHGRRSVRKYKSNVKVSKNELIEILRESSLAPSGGNLQV